MRDSRSHPACQAFVDGLLLPHNFKGVNKSVRSTTCPFAAFCCFQKLSGPILSDIYLIKLPDDESIFKIMNYRIWMYGKNATNGGCFFKRPEVWCSCSLSRGKPICQSTFKLPTCIYHCMDQFYVNKYTIKEIISFSMLCRVKCYLTTCIYQSI